MSRAQSLLRAAVAASAILMLGATASAQTPAEQVNLDYALTSGPVTNGTRARSQIFSTTVEVPDAPWMRLYFRDVELGESDGTPTVLRITSLLDGHSQILDATSIVQWRHSTAYFNGDAVLVEIIADPDAKPSSVQFDSISAGVPIQGGIATICGPTDDRVPSDDARVARLWPIGCTAWIIDDPNHCFLSAGHCMGAPDVCEFNVPLSTPSGDPQHPGPEDQYIVDATSIQSTNGGLGNDWAYFGCFENSNTGLTPFEAQGAFYELANAAPSGGGQAITITGHGVDSSPQEWNTIQQTQTGPYSGLSGTVIQYVTDTTGGNSGSAVLDETSGLAIGIHTNGGCSSGGGANSGCAIQASGLQNALLNPQGVCIPSSDLLFDYPDGLPTLINNTGDTIRVVVTGNNGASPAPGTGVLQLDTGSGFNAIAMTQVDPNVYDAVFPATECGDFLAYYFTAETSTGDVVADIFNAEANPHTAQSGVEPDFSFGDDFETNMNWSVSNAGGLTDGAWNRGTPVGGGDRGDPPTDADGSGQCYLTDNVDGNSDVDDGSTILTSPRLDATDGSDPHVAYYRWYSNTAGGSPNQDIFVIEISDDNGSTWSDLETVGPAGPEAGGGWFYRQFRVADFVEPTDTVRIRFTASDLGEGSVVEAGVDGVRLNRTALGVTCDGASIPGDLDGDGSVGAADLAILLAEWGPGDSIADLDGDGDVDAGDLAILLANWG